MRVALDMTSMPPARTGVGNYQLNLVRALARIDRETEYVVFAKSEHVPHFAVAQANVRFEATPFRNRVGRIAWQMLALGPRTRALGADVLHCTHYEMPYFVGTPTVVTFHDMTLVDRPELHQRTKRHYFPVMMRRSVRRAVRILTVSESTRQDVLQRYALPPERVVTVRLAAGDDFRPLDAGEIASVCRRYDLTPDRYVLYVGVLEPRKNVPMLIEAFGAVAKRHPTVQLAIAGQRGWMYEQIFAQVTRSGLEERVRFLGRVSDEELPALYSGARVFGYPSLYEGFGLPVLEAMKCGAPVITTRISSMPEVAGDAAAYVDPGDVPALADTLHRILGDDALARRMRERSLAVSAGFSWEQCAHETLSVYRAVAEQGDGAAR